MQLRTINTAKTPQETVIRNLSLAKPEIRGTTLITYIVPGNMDARLVTEHLKDEIATANNIQSKQVRTVVLSGLKSLMNTFNHYTVKGKTPANGLVLLAGQIQEEKGQSQKGQLQKSQLKQMKYSPNVDMTQWYV